MHAAGQIDSEVRDLLAKSLSAGWMQSVLKTPAPSTGGTLMQARYCFFAKDDKFASLCISEIKRDFPSK